MVQMRVNNNTFLYRLTAIAVCVCCLIICRGAASFADEPEPQCFTGDGTDFSLPSASQWGANLSRNLKKYLGIRYKRGGATAQGFDCSGFSRHVYKNYFGVELPRNASSQYPSSLLAPVPSDDLKPGDLIFFSASRKKKRINHVGIYLDGGKFIHAELRRGITISNLDDSHWKSRLVSAKRLADENSDRAAEEQFFDEPEGAFALRIPQRSAGRATRGRSGNSLLAKESLELAYSQFLLNNILRLQFSYFFKSFSTLSEGSDTPFTSLLPPFANAALVRGLRIAGDIRPLTGLSITPVVSYYDHNHSDTVYDIPARSLGIDVSLGSVQHWGWSLSTSVQQLSLTGDRKHTAAYDQSAFDLSLTYRQKLNDRLQLSLIGEHFRYPALQFTSDARDTAAYDQRLFFLLHFTY